MQEEMGLGEVYVELTGVDPDDHDLELVAKRTGLTDENGDVTFADLCPLDWKVRTIRYG